MGYLARGMYYIPSMIEDPYFFEEPWSNCLFSYFVPFYKLPSNYFDPMVHIIRQRKIDLIGKVMPKHPELQLLKFVSVSSVIHMPLEKWLGFDVFWQEGIFQSVQSYAKAQAESSKKEMDIFMKNMDAKRSVEGANVAPISKPNFMMP